MQVPAAARELVTGNPVFRENPAPAMHKSAPEENSTEGEEATRSQAAAPPNGQEEAAKLDRNTSSGLGSDVPSKGGGGSDMGIGASRRGTAIRPREAAGSVVWAKLAKYPWWPAQVLDPEDPWIPSGSEPPRHGAIPVRFFGTYDFAWIENQRAVCQYDSNYEEHGSKSRQKVFMDSMAEASSFQETGELPNGFNEDNDPSLQKPARKGKGVRGKGKKGEAALGTGARNGKRGDGPHRHRSVKERQEGIMRALGLAPPASSPFVHTLCLDGVRKLMELQEAGRWPPAQPVLPLHQQTVYGVQYPTSVGQSSLPHQLSHMTNKPIPLLQAQQALQAQQLQYQQQQQQLQQQIQQQLQQQQSQHPWYMQQAFTNQQVSTFFGGHGGVQGALLAAAGHFGTGSHYPTPGCQYPPDAYTASKDGKEKPR